MTLPMARSLLAEIDATASMLFSTGLAIALISSTTHMKNDREAEEAASRDGSDEASDG